MYYKDQVIVNADASSFKKLEKSKTYEDKNGAYKQGKLITTQTEAPK